MAESEALDLTLRALLLASLHTLEPDDQIDILARAGWNNQQIGVALNMTANAVQKRRAGKKART